MNYNNNIVGAIEFDGSKLNVYSSLDEPIFRAADIADTIGYSEGNVWKMLKMCEEDEKLILPVMVDYQLRNVAFVTETGLYNILNQSRMPAAVKWRKEQRINDRLIRMRKNRGMTVVDQFREWDDIL